MQQLVFATSNPNKLKEVSEMLQGRYQIISMAEIGCTVDIPETSPTFEGNALQKARYLYEHFQVDCFSEDTGLEVDALNGAPGVYTARYAGPQRNADDNMDLLLRELSSQSNRRARFRTAMALIIDGQEHTFEGIVNGTIAKEKTGAGGFGYDPVFIPDGYEHSFAVLPSSVKHQISHRSRALAKLIAFLSSL